MKMLDCDVIAHKYDVWRGSLIDRTRLADFHGENLGQLCTTSYLNLSKDGQGPLLGSCARIGFSNRNVNIIVANKWIV